MPTYASFKNELFWKYILYTIVKTIFLVFISVTIPIIKWQITGFIKKLRKKIQNGGVKMKSQLNNLAT